MKNPIYSFPIKIIRNSFKILNPEISNFGRNWKMFSMKEYANDLIFTSLSNNHPTMIARLGSTELTCMTNYIGVNYPERFKNINTFITSKTPPWWWEQSIINQMQNWSGFFPASVEKIEKFCEMMLKDITNVDILGSWLKHEVFFDNQLEGAKKVMLEDLEPFFSVNPWTRALEGKKIVVIHPFSETIEQQYAIREKIFPDGLLPKFHLITIKAVQSIAGQKTEFKDWFEALDSMKAQIDKLDFDICILGCGAYGFPLASYIKSIGKKAIHLGGVTQLLFGIKGKRWENYIVYPYKNLYNEYWVRPGEKEKPKNAGIVEGACYW